MFRCCGVSILGDMRRIVVEGNTTDVLWCTVHMNESGRHRPSKVPGIRLRLMMSHNAANFPTLDFVNYWATVHCLGIIFT